jgi:hypothetical protein
MAREYDAQLLESVAVRRNRMREALLWGRERRARATMDNLKRLGISVVLAAVACAGCVGWSLLQQLLADRQQQFSTSMTVPGMTATGATVRQ